MAKLITAAEAAAMVQDEDVILCTTFGASGVPEDIFMEMEKRFLETGHPANLSYTHAAGSGSFAALGDGTYCRGEDHICHTGMLKRWVASHSACSDFCAKQIAENAYAAWCLPLGTMIHMWREQARGLKGCLSKVGLNTYVDPRFQGGAINPKAEEAIKNGETYVEYIPDFRGEEFLFYKGFEKYNIGFMRGTKMDKNGNMSIEKEPYNFESLTIAQAVKATGGTVIAQVEEIVEVGEIHPKLVKVPGIYIDYVVIEKDPSVKVSTVGGLYNPAFTGETRIDLGAGSADVMPLNGNKVICRRAAMEVREGMVGNFGLGMPQSVGSILAEEGVSDYVTMLSESGSIGGVPASGVNFGAHYNIEASCDQGDHFNFFDAGGLDIGAFGLSEVDPIGGMNVAVLNGAVKGVGGFMNIAAGANRIIVLGTFTAGGIKAVVQDGKLVIEKEGRFKKFVNDVGLNAIDAVGAVKSGRPVTYITERCVFELDEEGLLLTEIAPGIDLQTQILDLMEFTPRIAEGGPKLMPAEIFQENWGGLKAYLDAQGKLVK